MYFPNPKAVLPVLTRAGDIDLIPWGRREQQPGALPVTGWARLDTIRQGRWAHCQPIPVKIPILSFMEKDRYGSTHWYDLAEDEFIQGLLATKGDDKRVYVVTVPAEQNEQVDIHPRWPRVIKTG